MHIIQPIIYTYLMYDLNTNGGELVQLLGVNSCGWMWIWGWIHAGELTSTHKKHAHMCKHNMRLTYQSCNVL